LREEQTTDEVACAYRAVFFNRTTFSGIFNSGPIGGKDQSSKYPIGCRYNANKLREKIIKCHKLLMGRTTVTNSDFSQLDVFTKTNTPAYCDPPYYIKGDVLYREKMIPHEHFVLRNILDSRDNWVLSYDDCPPIRAHYENKTVIDLTARYSINGKKIDWATKNELIILP
jgi:DNA adenine methylase